MTYLEFLEALRSTPRDWRIGEFGKIERGLGDSCDCPWSAIADDSGQPDVFDDSNLRQSVLRVTPLIWAAADNRQNHDPKIRKDLLEACGLTEVVAPQGAQ